MEEYPRTIYGHDRSGKPRCPAVDAQGTVDVSTTRVSGWKKASIKVADDDVLSTMVDLGEHFRYLAVLLPTLDLTRVGLMVAQSANGAWTPLGKGATAQTEPTTGDHATVFDTGGWRYIRLYTTAAQTADRDFYVQGVRG